MDKIASDLINAILTKYEGSSSFRKSERPTRRIMLKLHDNGKCEFSLYNIEQTEQRAYINQIILELAAQELIEFSWMQGEENHIISKVWLNFDKLFDVYEYVGRQPKNELIDGICDEVLRVLNQVNTIWIKQYLNDLYSYIKNRRTLGNKLLEDKAERNSLLLSLKYIDANHNEESLERVFSMQCFGDSKEFERTVKSRLLSILRKYLDCDEDVADEELFRQVGINKYPEQFEFCGQVELRFADGTYVDYSNLQLGTSIYLEDLLRGVFILKPTIKTIISIENKTNYLEYIHKHKQADELIIYHGGQYSASKKKFLLSVAQVALEIPWFHWGDIDYGGFSMLARLRREIYNDVRPYRMGKSELIAYQDLAAPITAAYKEKLQKLMFCKELSDCQTCIEYMLEQHIRLEQEAMLK